MSSTKNPTITMMSKEKNFFPINTETACKLKWSWSTLYLHTGKSASCHRTAFYPLTTTNFDNFHNNEVVVNDRLRMLEGKWPDENCSYCKEIEDAGGFSDRMQHLSIPDQVPAELEKDPHAINVTPRILEIFLNNVCNLGCLYCSESNSSVIDQENIKFGKFEKNGVVLKALGKDHSAELFPLVMNWLDKNYQHLERLHVLGGEPFFQKEFQVLLDFLSQHKNSNCEINIITNLMVPFEKLKKFIEQFKSLAVAKKIKRLDITCSIDCFGPQQEYVRSGLNLDQWKKNFEYLVSQKWIKLNINQVITVLTIKTMPKLLEYLNTQSKTRNIGQYFSTPPAQVGPTYMHPKILGSNEFVEDFKRIIGLMRNSTDEEQTMLRYMQGIISECQSGVQSPKEILKLFTFLDEKDRRRNTSWKVLFPWLEKYVVQ